MSIGERLFRVVWLGPIGNGFVRLAGRGLASESAASGVSGAVLAPSAPSQSAPARSSAVRAPDRVEALEMRVAELERWRRDN